MGIFCDPSVWNIYVSFLGQSIIEYPTFYICFESILPKLRLLITPIEEFTATLKKDINKQSKRKISLDQCDTDKKMRLEQQQYPDETFVCCGNEGIEGAKLSDEEEVEEVDDSNEEEDEGNEYDEFMQEFVNLQNAGIEELKSLIKTEEET